MLYIKGEFRENRLRDGHILLKGLNDFLPVFPIIRERTGWNSAKIISVSSHRVIMNFMLIDTVTAIFYSGA
jgi:hypothetical protein